MDPKLAQNEREQSGKIWLWAPWAAKGAPKEPQRRQRSPRAPKMKPKGTKTDQIIPFCTFFLDIKKSSAARLAETNLPGHSLTNFLKKICFWGLSRAQKQTFLNVFLYARNARRDWPGGMREATESGARKVAPCIGHRGSTPCPRTWT